MGKVLLEYLDGDNIYACVHCGAHLSGYRELLSKVVCSLDGLSIYMLGFQRTRREIVSIQTCVRVLFRKRQFANSFL